MSSHPLYRQHHTHSFYDITLAISVTSFALYKTSQPHFLISNHHLEDITPTIIDSVHCICVITPTLSMISKPQYVWYHILYMWDILSTIFMTSYPLCMTTQPCVLFTPHSAYVWHHLRYRIRHIHSITPSHNLYDFTSTSGITSHPLYQTSHTLYSCHHTQYTCHRIHWGCIITYCVLIIPHLLYVWHQTHYM